MYRWTNQDRMQRILLLLAVSHCFILTESASNEFMPQTLGDACPGDVLMYNCTINGGGSTIWSGSAFDCETRMDEIILRHSQFVSGSSGNCNDGAVTAQSLGVVDSTCFTSQLSVTVGLEMNNKTVLCAHSSEIITTIGVGIISVATAPPANVRLSDARPGELTFNWRTSTDRETGLNYTVNSTCGVCPIMTNTTMVTCSGLTLSTTPTVCTFSIRRVACGTIGSPSIPIIVTLFVPDAPNVTVVPHYSLKDNEQLLTGIIVRVQQEVTSFPITNTIPGSITSYSISYGSNIQNKTACMNRTCEYAVDLPPSICSTTDPTGVDVTVAAANVLGLGPPTQSVTIECNSQFARVNYYSINTTLSCTFLNELDPSPKSCTVRYGICGREEYTIQGDVSDESPFEISIGLNSNIVESTNNCCYIIMARNGTYEIMVNGSCASLPASKGVDNARDLRLVSLIVLAIPITIIIIVVVLGFTIFWKRKVHGRCANDDTHQHDHELEELEDHPELLYKDLYPINSKHFIESTLTSKLSEFHKQKELKKEDLIFVEYKFIDKPERVKICDVILKYMNGRLYTGPYARNIVNNGKDLSAEWENVFVLPHDRIRQQLKAETLVLYQDRDQLKKKIKLRVFDVDEDNVDESTKLSKFLKQKLNNFDFDDYARAYYEFADDKMDLLHYREVMEVSNSKLEEAKSTGKGYIILESSTGRGIHMFYKLKPQAPGVKVKPPYIKDGRCFVQSTPQDSDRCLKDGSLVLYEEDVDAESHR